MRSDRPDTDRQSPEADTEEHPPMRSRVNRQRVSQRAGAKRTLNVWEEALARLDEQRRSKN